jgi:hypothetical protein
MHEANPRIVIVGGGFGGRLYSTFAPENSLTAYGVASNHTALLLASTWWPLGFVLATVYFVFISRRYAGKISVKRDYQGFY